MKARPRFFIYNSTRVFLEGSKVEWTSASKLTRAWEFLKWWLS